MVTVNQHHTASEALDILHNAIVAIDQIRVVMQSIQDCAIRGQNDPALDERAALVRIEKLAKLAEFFAMEASNAADYERLALTREVDADAGYALPAACRQDVDDAFDED